MKILGIDPGYERCGIAIIEKQQGGKETVVFSTCLRTSAKDDFPKRLFSIGSNLEKIIFEFKPDCAAIEEALGDIADMRAAIDHHISGAHLGIIARRDNAMEPHVFCPDPDVVGK